MSLKPAGHKRNRSPWVPIGPFRVWLRKEAAKAGNTNRLSRELNVSDAQMLRWLKRNKWVPLEIVDDLMIRRGQMWTDIYDLDAPVNSATARGVANNFDEHHERKGTDGHDEASSV